MTTPRTNALRRSKSRLAVAAGLLLWTAALAPGALAADDQAADVLVALVEAERVRLEESIREYDRQSLRRARTDDQLTGLYETLDGLVKRGDDEGMDRVRRIREQIETLEDVRRGVLLAQRGLLDRIEESRRRMALLEERVAAISDRDRAKRGPISGEWTVTLLPRRQAGRFRLRQDGTLVSGSYTLDGGFDGSLQGTLVDRKLFLVRIDSRLGKTMEFEGFLSSDKQTIRGSWLDYDLARGTEARGEWSARRATEDDER